MTPDQYATKGEPERILHSAAPIWVSEHKVLLSHKKGPNPLGILEAIKNLKFHLLLAFCVLVLYTDNLCKQFGPRSGPTKYEA